MVVVLETVDALTVLAVTLDTSESVPCILPVALHVLNDMQQHEDHNIIIIYTALNTSHVHVEPLYKDTPEIKDTSLNRTLSSSPSSMFVYFYTSLIRTLSSGPIVSRLEGFHCIRIPCTCICMEYKYTCTCTCTCRSYMYTCHSLMWWRGQGTVTSP